MSTGYIKLFRCLKQSAFYKDSEYVHLWVHLLMSVNRSEKRLKIGKTNKFIDLQPGQVLTSRDKLSEQTGIHRSKVDRILNAFKVEQQIGQQTFSKYRVISISNWQSYQCSEQQNEQQKSSKRAASEPQVSTNKKEEETREKIPLDGFEKERMDFFEAAWKIYPADGRIKKKEALRHYLATVKTDEDINRINYALENYILHLQDNEWKKPQNGSTWFNNWQDWEVEIES